MTLNQLKAFEAVSNCLSITRASQALGISEPSVFQQIKLLEESIGAKVYRKVGRTIELTQAGKAIQGDVRNLLGILSKVEDRFRHNSSRDIPERLIVGGSYGPSTVLLPSIIAVFKKHHPQVQVILRTRTSRSIEKLLIKSEIEVALITNLPQSPLLQSMPYRVEDFVAFISAKSPLAKKNRLTMAELAQCPLIIKKQRSNGGNYLRQIESQGFRLNILMECESAETIKTAVISGMGLGFLYRDHLKSEIKRGELKILKIPALEKPVACSYIVYRKDRPLSKYGMDFLDLMKRTRDRLKTDSGTAERVPLLILPSKNSKRQSFGTLDGAH